MSPRLVRALFPVLVALAAASLALAAPQEQRADDLESFPGDDVVDLAIAAGELRGHVQALSSDALRGRPMGSPESLLAAAYVVGRLEAMGVAPGAGSGSYMQSVPLTRTHYTDVPEIWVKLASGSVATLFNGEDFTFRSSGAAYETRELRCVVVKAESDLPEEADADVALVMATSAGRSRKWLAAAGYPRGAGFGLILLPKKAKSGERSVPPDGRLGPKRSTAGVPQVSLRGDWSEAFSSGEIASVTFVSNGGVEDVEDFNVVGVLAGADTKEHPELAEEIVILSAHRDHIGIDGRIKRSDPEADAIRNGADDDASGCAAILEIAEALAAGPRPARTTVFLFVTGEEAGMVGSRYWVAHPTHEIKRVVCALNFEMLGRPDDLVGGAGNLWLTGDERSDLGDGLRDRGLAIQPDARPTFKFFSRSDNVSFAKVGIVAQTLSSYGEHTDYHKVSDEWDTLDYDHMETVTRTCLEVVRALTAGDWTPAWNEGEPKF